jgi:hypothetical protein
MNSVEMNALVRAVPASDVAEVASNAFLFVDTSNYLVVQIQMFPLGHLWQAPANKITDVFKTLLIHPVAEAIDQILNDAIAVMHDGGTYLHGVAPEQDELGGVLPVCYAADA